MHLSKSLAIIIVIVAAIFLIGVGVMVGAHINSNSTAVDNNGSLSPYSAVYLATGDVYFGVLDWYPSPHIEDAWFLERGTNAGGQATVGVYPFSQVAWGPSGTVYFNTQQIVFWTRLSSTSSVAEAIANPSAVVPMSQSVTPEQSSPSSTATSSPLSSSTIQASPSSSLRLK